MSTKIVTDIYPPPAWNLTEEDIHQMVEELKSYYQDFKPAFERRDQAAHGWVYLKGLLSDLPRKVTERIALRFGVNVRSLQHFIGQSVWQCEGLLERHQARVVETLGEEDGVVLVDESGMVKQGEHSVGVARQWCGSVGKVANSQVGVYLGYASRKGHSFLDTRLFLPQEWFAETHAEMRQDCGVPGELSYQTKPEIGLELLKNALERGELPFQWVAADELYGDSPQFRDGIAGLNKWYLVEVRCTTQVWLERPEVGIPPWTSPGDCLRRLGCEPKSKKVRRVRWYVILPACGSSKCGRACRARNSGSFFVATWKIRPKSNTTSAMPRSPSTRLNWYASAACVGQSRSFSGRVRLKSDSTIMNCVVGRVGITICCLLSWLISSWCECGSVSNIKRLL